MKPRIKYRIIHRHSGEYPVSVMCVFEVSGSGCYAFVHRLSKPERAAALAELIAQQRECSYRTCGYRRMWLWLKRQNIFRICCCKKIIIILIKPLQRLASKRLWRSQRYVDYKLVEGQRNRL